MGADPTAAAACLRFALIAQPPASQGPFSAATRTPMACFAHRSGVALSFDVLVPRNLCARIHSKALLQGFVHVAAHQPVGW